MLSAGLYLSNISSAQESRPNILVIMTDQQAAIAMSCTGNPHLKTPAMDSIAARGVRFERAYVTQPLCLPCRSSMLAGRYPHEIGTVTNGTKYNRDWPMLGKMMSDGGYECAYIGKWHVGAPADYEHAGYTSGGPGGKDHEKAADAVKYLSRMHEKPFFLTVSFVNPHNVCQLARHQPLPDGPIPPLPKNMENLPPLPDNFGIPENEPAAIREVQEMSRGKHYPTKDWDERLWREYLWGYYRICEKVDAEVAKVLEAVQENGFAGNTVVMFVADHGEGIAAHHWNQKQVLYEEAVRVPCMIASPQSPAAGKVSTALVSTGIDYLPTILDFAEIPCPDTMPGHSLKPITLGKSETLPRRYVVAETIFASGTRQFGVSGRMLRTAEYKYTIYNKGNCREQLFDMDRDPGEMNNLAVDNEFRHELNRHRQLLADWARETNDDFPYVDAL
jgi:arylsulfatase A-like enzyme